MKISGILAVYQPSPNLTIDFESATWAKAQALSIDKHWNGAAAPPELWTNVRVIWNEREILLGFECAYTELDVDEQFDAAQERYALWDRDVCEAFIRSPLEPHPRAYREFEIAPTGQWCDLIIDWEQNPPHGLKDWEWQSGMKTVCEIDVKNRIWRGATAIPFTAFDCAPSAGEIWKANLYRISRLHGERQYLTYSPTLTEQPNFHVAESFVDLHFD